MWYNYFACLLLIYHNNQWCYGAEQKPSELIKSHRVYIDSLTEKYLTIEKELWTKIDTKQLIVERGELLNEIYREHGNVFDEDFGSTNTIWTLGIQQHEKLIHNILAINSNAQNNKQYLLSKEYPKVIDLAKNAMEQMENTATDFYHMISEKSFWNNILFNIANGQCKEKSVDVPNGSQLIFDIHQEASAILLKSYINVQLAYLILKVTEEENAKQKSDDYRKIFRERYTALQLSTKDLLQKTTKRKWSCDKSNYPATYYQITRFIQGYVDNEINLNPDESCKRTCPDYPRTKNYGCQPDTPCAEVHIDQKSTRCKGTVLNCDYIEDDLSFCPATQKLNSRRYDFIRYSSGKTFGKFDACLQSSQATSWRSWFVECNTCFCYCDDPNDDLSDRYFSLHDVTSNINENRIVTGVSITKRNRMIQFIVAESTLLPFGKINTTFSKNEGDDQNALVNNRFVSHHEFNINGAGIKNGIDYHTLTYENRLINLDTVIAPSGKLLTGIRFHLTDDSKLTLQIRATDFNYETGKLEHLDKSVWLSTADKKRTKLVLQRPDVPILSPLRSEPDWTPNQYVEFGPSDRDKDAGQVTVPFIDGITVEAKPTILSGAGLYYKGQPGYGGFIAPLLITYDYESLIIPLEK